DDPAGRPTSLALPGRLAHDTSHFRGRRGRPLPPCAAGEGVRRLGSGRAVGAPPPWGRPLLAIDLVHPPHKAAGVPEEKKPASAPPPKPLTVHSATAPPAAGPAPSA